MFEVLLANGWQDAGAAIGYTTPFNLANEGVQLVLEQLADRVKGIADTTRDDIQRLVGQAAEEGWSTSRLAGALQDKRELASLNRATMVAHTEAASAYTQGSIVLYQDSGIVSEVEWMDADGCDICAPLNGVRVPLGEDIPRRLMVPAHPNCRCAIAPVV